MTYLFELYDIRHYATIDVVVGYSQWAPHYGVDSQLDLSLLELRSVPWTEVESAVDLGCATGRISDHIASGRQMNWTLLEMQESVVDGLWVAQKPNMAKYLYQPISFCMVWQIL